MTSSLLSVGSYLQGLASSESEVHVWTVFLDFWEKNYIFLLEGLDEVELVRAAQFRLERDRRRFVIRRSLLRKLLSFYLGISGEMIRFTYGMHGKPYLSNNHSIWFNTSHSEGLALYAISFKYRVGIDLEMIQSVPEIDALLIRWFLPCETSFLDNLPAPEKLTAFYQLWTKKEAYLKALGNGLSDLEDIADIAPEDRKLAQHHPSGGSSQFGPWSFQILSPANNFIATLAVAGLDYQLRCFEWGTAIGSH